MTALDQDCLLLKASFWPMRWVFCLNQIELKSTCIFSFNALKTKASVFSRSPSAIPCSKRQLRRKYCSCLSTIFSCFSIFSFMLNTSFFTMSIILSFSRRSRLYSSNLLIIQLIASLKKFSWFSTLIWLFLFFHISGEIFYSLIPTFSYNYKELLHSLLTSKIQ